MPAVTFESLAVVRIEIRGEPHPKGFPYCPDDGGLVGLLLKKILDEDIWTARGGSSGGGGYVGYFLVNDAPRIDAFLREHGATETDPTGGWR